MLAIGTFLAIKARDVHVPQRFHGHEYVEDAVTGFDIGGRSLPARVDLISIGCSQTFGHGVRPDQNFTALVAKHAGMTAANLAVPSFGGAGSVLQLERHAAPRPRLVIYGLWAEHRVRNVAPCVESITPICIERPVVKRVDGELRITPPRIGGLTRTRAWMAAASDGFGGKMYAAAADFVDNLRRPSWSSVDQASAEEYLLITMARDAKQIGARLMVVYLPDYNRGWPSTPDYAALAQRHGFTFIDTTADLRALERAGIDVGIPGDGHLSAASHAAIAARIARELETLH